MRNCLKSRTTDMRNLIYHVSFFPTRFPLFYCLHLIPSIYRDLNFSPHYIFTHDLSICKHPPLSITSRHIYPTAIINTTTNLRSYYSASPYIQSQHYCSFATSFLLSVAVFLPSPLRVSHIFYRVSCRVIFQNSSIFRLD